jgi:DNA-binding transcriptional LysR family regulator
MMRMQWDDLRYVLAVARAGSALRAAEALGVNQTTVLRRVDAAEAAAGGPLFERRKTGLTLTAIGRMVAEAAARMEQETQALNKALSAQQREIAGSVRLTASEVIDVCLISPCLGEFHARYPGIAVELITSNERLDIAGGDADVALRAGVRPEGAGIVARRLPDIAWTIYCSRSYAAVRGVPGSREEIVGHDVVGMEGQMARIRGWLWLEAAASGTVVRLRSNSLLNLVSHLKAGLGLGALPVIMGDVEPELVRCFAPPAELNAELWLIVREGAKYQPPVRALAEFLAQAVHARLTTPQMQT